MFTNTTYKYTSLSVSIYTQNPLEPSKRIDHSHGHTNEFYTTGSYWNIYTFSANIFTGDLLKVVRMPNIPLAMSFPL